ncbi:MAG TPA: hypothetical protein VM049_04720 [Gaiellaceae bacterium]|nr:hypothetical protein [Gaiellaceae bacterium]
MAEDVTPKRIPALVETRGERARQTSYRLRFGALYVLLAAIVGAGVGSFVVLASRDAPAAAAAWSSWAPEGSRDASAKQIADHVSKRYRLPSGDQLAVALVGPPKVQDVSVRAIAVRPDTSTGQAEDEDVDVVETGKSIMYILCGLGESCSIKEGRPTEARHQLLRREALELSLYTFKYVDDVESVVVFLPPRADMQVGSSLFLKKSEVRDELRRPLRSTLRFGAAPALGQIDTIELGNIDRLTRPRTFQYEFQQTQEGSAILVLTPAVLGT